MKESLTDCGLEPSAELVELEQAIVMKRPEPRPDGTEEAGPQPVAGRVGDQPQISDDGAGDGAGDALDLLDVPHDHAPEIVHGGRLGAGDDVVGPGHALGHDHARDGVDLLGHLGRLADVGLDQDVRMDGHGTPYIGVVAMSPKIEQFKDMARQAQKDLFDQTHPIGRLSLVQCAMLAGGTAVTISLAGSLFFSISPTAADHKVLLYLLFTLAPFAIVSPLLGPLIDRSRGARRLMVVSSAVGQVVLCPLMATHVHSLLLFPLAFLVLVCQKLYLVTKGALVPEMAALTAPDEHGEQAGYAPAQRPADAARHPGRLRHLRARGDPLQAGRLPGRARPGHDRVRRGGGRGRPAAGPLGAARASGCGPTKRPGCASTASPGRRTPASRTCMRLQPIANPEVMLGLTAMCIVRGLTGFMTFMLAFGLRRMNGVGLYWYGLVLASSGVGAIIGLVLVGRLRKHMTEQQLLLCSLWLIAATAAGCAVWGTLFAQVVLAFMVGLCGAVAQPSFDAMTQRYIPLSAQGRAFARFGMRQQLVWVVGSLIPVIIAFTLPAGGRDDGGAGRARRALLRLGPPRRPRAAHGAGRPRHRRPGGDGRGGRGRARRSAQPLSRACRPGRTSAWGSRSPNWA